MRVVFSPLAEDDLTSIGDRIAEDDPHQAVKFIREVRERCEKIAMFPKSAPLRNDLQRGIRMIVHGNYVVFYRVLKDTARIERIVHGARDIGRLL